MLRNHKRIPNRGLLIVFSGIDGGGRSTQINLLTDRLHALGYKTKYLWTRGGYTVMFEFLKSLLRHFSGGRALPISGNSPQRAQAFSRPIVRKIWLTLALIDLLWVYGIYIRGCLLRGKIVICDRYLWDTQVDFRINFPADKVEGWWLWQLLVKVTPRPQASFLMLVPVEESMQRSAQKGVPFNDSSDVLTRRLAIYQALASRDYWQTLDGLRSKADLAGEIWERVRNIGPFIASHPA